MPNDSIQKWEGVMNLSCATTKTIKITSYGDWDFTLRKMSKGEVSRPIDDIIKQYENDCYSNWEDDQSELQVEEYPQLKNALVGLENITVNINYTEEQFKQMFGFWEISNFKVYNRDGNSSLCSFDDEKYYYFGFYGTS